MSSMNYILASLLLVGSNVFALSINEIKVGETLVSKHNPIRHFTVTEILSDGRFNDVESDGTVYAGNNPDDYLKINQTKCTLTSPSVCLNEKIVSKLNPIRHFTVTEILPDGRFNDVESDGTVYAGNNPNDYLKPVSSTSSEVTSNISIASLPQNLSELSKQVYDRYAKLLQGVAQDLSKAENQSEESSALMLFALNGFVNQLTAPVIEQNFKPKYVEAMTQLKSENYNSVDDVDLDPETVNMAISITEKSLQSILQSSSLKETNVKQIRGYITKLARDVSPQTGELRRAMAFGQFAKELVESGILNSALENPRTAPEASMINLVMGWITKKY